MILRKIISGGQTGADQGGLRAGRALGLETGGWVPRGWLTLDGPAPWLAGYGCVEAPTSEYAPRTEMNVRDSDATIRFALDLSTPGERCTLRAIEKYGKPFTDVTWVDLTMVPANQVATRLAIFLRQHCVAVLNVAGNSDRRAPGIEWAVVRLLVLTVAQLW